MDNVSMVVAIIAKGYLGSLEVIANTSIIMFVAHYFYSARHTDDKK